MQCAPKYVTKYNAEKMPKTPDQIQQEKQDLITSIEAAIAEKASKLQAVLWASILSVLLDLKVDDKGKVIFSTPNIAKGRAISDVFLRFKNQSQAGLGKWLMEKVKDLFGVNRRYAEAINEKFGAASVEERSLAKHMENLGYDIKTGKVLPGSWLDGLTAADSVKQTVFGKFRQAIEGKADLATFRKSFEQEFTSKTSGLGLLERHYKLHTSQMVMGLDRAIAQEYATAAGLEYFIYVGSNVTGTRDFCRPKAGLIFHESIFEVWDKQDWDGKIPGAQTRYVLGGYACRHHASFISKEMARRMAKSGKPHGLTPAQVAELMKD